MGGKIYHFPEKYRERVRIERALSRKGGRLFAWFRATAQMKTQEYLWGIYTDGKSYSGAAFIERGADIIFHQKIDEWAFDKVIGYMRSFKAETNNWALYALGIAQNPPGTSENKILALPGVPLPVDQEQDEETNKADKHGDEPREKTKPRAFICPPGTPVPPGIPDFRRQLQRDGLILASYYREFSTVPWGKGEKITGRRWCAVWMAATGKAMRLYRADIIAEQDAGTVRPGDTSDITEAWHGNFQQRGYRVPYIVHVVPHVPEDYREFQGVRRIYTETARRIWPGIDCERVFRLTDEKKKEAEAKRRRRARAIMWKANQKEAQDGQEEMQ